MKKPVALESASRVPTQEIEERHPKSGSSPRDELPSGARGRQNFPPGQKGPSRTEPSGLGWLWWLVILGLVVWNAWALLPAPRPEAALPYSQFISEVTSDNIKSVKISGNEISGEFVKPVPWPLPLSGSATSPQTGTTQQSYSRFLTTFPEVVGDPNLLPLLESHHVTINVAQPPSRLLTGLLSNGLPILLLVSGLIWLGWQLSRNQSGALSFGRSRARRYSADEPDVKFKDIAGADEAKEELQEVVDFLQHPKKYHDLGARIPRGVLLVGPPGTGKTLMARAVAGEAGVPFLSISASEFVEMFVGVGASRVRDLFERAKAVAPAIVFIDELDAVGRRRGAGLGTVNDEREQTLNQLLVEMDGFDELHEVIVLAATNRPDVLDPALLRPGRFDRHITVGLPDRKGREGILRIHTQGLPLARDADLELLSRTTTGFSGADLANLCNEAALSAARHNHQMVTLADFEEAMDKILLGGAHPVLLDVQERRVVAYHESGHALVAWLTPGADPVRKVTIIPHGRALGVTETLPGEDHFNYSQEYLLARLAVLLSGRVAEQVALGRLTTGAENDLLEATRLARRMVTRWGMGSLGPMALSGDEEQPFLGYQITQYRDYSEAIAAQIDRDVQALLEERQESVRRLLNENRNRLDAIVNSLLHEETLNQNSLAQILGPRPEAEPELAAPSG